MLKYVLGILLLFSIAAYGHDLRPPVVVSSGDMSVEIEQPLHKNEIIVRVIDPKVNTKEVTCSVSRLHGNDLSSSMHLFDLTLIKFPNSYGTNTYVGIYRDEKNTPHGSTTMVEYKPQSDQKPLRATIKMYYH